MQYDIFVSRHLDLKNFLIKKNIIPHDIRSIEHVDNIEDIRGLNAIGVLASKIAVFCRTVTEVPLNIPKEIKNRELTIEELEIYSEPLVTYEVREIPVRTDFSEAILISNSGTFVQHIIRENIIPRGGKQHMEAINRKKLITIEELKNKPIIGSLPYHKSCEALDCTQYKLYYDYSLRGKIHDYTTMQNCNQGLFTFTVRKLS